MDIKTKDGILLRGIPDGTPEDVIKGRINKIRSERKDNSSVALPEVTPGQEPLSYGNMMKDSLSNVAKGFMTSGPLGGMGAAVGEGFGNMGKIMERGGYKGGEAVTDILAPYVSPEVAGGAGYMTNVGIQAIPALFGAIGGQELKPGLEYLGKGRMWSALKPNQKEILSGDAEKIVQTLLNRGINVTEGGATKLRKMTDPLNQRVNDIISKSTKSVTKTESGREIAKLLKKTRNQVNPDADLGVVSKSWKQFDRTNPSYFPIKKAQDLKQGTYQMLEKKAFDGLQNADVEAQKALARGLRSGVEKQEPGVIPLNKELSELYNAIGPVERRAGIAANRDLLGLTPAALNPQAMAAMLMDRSQWVKSMLARALYSTGKGPLLPATGASLGAVLGNQQAKP